MMLSLASHATLYESLQQRSKTADEDRQIPQQISSMIDRVAPPGLPWFRCRLDGTPSRWCQPTATVGFSVLVALMFTAPMATSTPGGERPNIVFIYTDDQAPTAVGIEGNEQIRTPHMNRLFREGARLADALVTTPVCSPSRASLTTSRYGTELGIMDWIDPRRESEHGLDPKTITWSEVLAEAGYATGLAGKWHLGTADRFHPTKTGYQYFVGFRSGGNSPKDPTLELDGKARIFKGLTADILTDHAIDFIRRNQQGPFLLSLHFRAPHARWLPVRDEDWRPYRDLDPRIPNPNFPQLDVLRVKRMTRKYMASVSSVDRNLGRLLDVIDAAGLKDNTVVIFTSDHGYHLGHNVVWDKGNAQWQLTRLPPQRWPHIPPLQRPNLYDQALRVPAAVRCPHVN